MPTISSADSLPDDLWLRIFHSGIGGSYYGRKDLSSLTRSCKRFNALSKEEVLWRYLLYRDFPPPPPLHHSSRALYKETLKRYLVFTHDYIIHELTVAEGHFLLLAHQTQASWPQFVARNDSIREFLVQVANTSSADSHGHLLKHLYDRMTNLLGSFGEYGSSGEGSSINLQAPLEFSSHYCYKYLQQQQSQIEVLINRQLEHKKQYEAVGSHLLSFD